MLTALEKLLLFDPTHKKCEEHWYFSDEVIVGKTPSRQRGMDYAEELKQRREAVRFMKTLAENVYNHLSSFKQFQQLSARVLATAALWFHRFYMIHPLDLFDRYHLAATCFYLASKAEDSPVTLNSIASHSLQILNWFEEPNQLSTAELEEELKDLENIVMKTSGFVVWVKHPYLFIQLLIDLLIGDPVRISKIQQLAAQYATDSLGATFSLRIEPKKMAIIFLQWACNKEGTTFKFDAWKQKPKSASEETPFFQWYNVKQEEVDKTYKEYCEHLRLDNAENEQATKFMLRRARISQNNSAAVQQILAERRQEPIVDKNDNFEFVFNVPRNHTYSF